MKNSLKLLNLSNKFLFPLILLSAFVFCFSTARAQTTAFNFQGRLNDGTSPANGRYDLEFRLYDALTGDNIIGTAISKPNLMLINGVFSTQLDFGLTAFNGANRFIEIRLRQTATGSNPPNAFLILGPRQQILSVPYTIRSSRATLADDATHAVNADSATYAVTATNATNAQNAVNATNATNATNAQTAVNSQQLGGVAASQYLQKGAMGLPRAILRVNSDGVITTCYNAVTGASTGNCGFTTTHSYIGVYQVDFGFNVVSSVVTATSEDDYADTVVTLRRSSATSIYFDVRYIQDFVDANTGALTNAAVNIVVY